jgi:phosphoribosylcarboxyaminoimidazole (NCAIR) mutase
VLDPANAALLAAKILGVSDAHVREKVIEFQQKQAAKILSDDTVIHDA